MSTAPTTRQDGLARWWAEHPVASSTGVFWLGVVVGVVVWR